MTIQVNGSPKASLNNTLLVVPLSALGKNDLERAGGKGANLGELMRAGFPVPPGFAVTTAAYERFVDDNNLHQLIVRALTGQAVDGNGAAIRAAFEAAPIPPEVEREVLAAYHSLGRGPVAVRSSATAEDLPEAAFAGQQDTYLNILGEDALLDAVRRCWASLWTDRAINYRERLGLDQRAVKLAVVVQQMVAADAAGVMFTANPVSGARDEILIDSNPGLGEAIVSGLVTPDHFRMQRGRWGWRIAERRKGQHEIIIQARQGGGTEHITGQPAAAAPTLPDLALRRLARLGEAIQRHFGGPQDIEWAWADENVFILQARPITALPAPPPQVNKLQQMLTNNFVEMLPVRPYPLDLDTWLAGLGRAVEPLFEMLGLEWQFSRLFEIEDGIVHQYRAALPSPTAKILLAPARLLSRMVRYDPTRWLSDPLLAEMISFARELEERDLAPLSWEQLLAMVREANKIPHLAAGEVRSRYFPRAAFGAARLRLLLGMLGHSDQLVRLLSGVENKTMEMNHALEELAGQVRSNPTLAQIFAANSTGTLLPALAEQPAGRDFQDRLSAFFRQYGHRETVISTSLEPTWKNAPELVLGILKTFAAQPPQPQTGKPAWQAARDEVLQHRLFRFAPARAAFLRTLDDARALLHIREDTHFYATMAMPVFRRVLLEMGRRLAGQGALDCAEDIYHLRFEALERLTGRLPLSVTDRDELHAEVERRKAARARLEAKPLVDPRTFANVEPGEDALLQGTAGSPGVAEGPARIVRSFAEFDRLAAGEVLVAPFTNPSWTPLFQRAAAVVVDSGSPASHAAIVAREYGIPAVMGTQTGTQTLRDGERIRVDGNRGIVSRAKPALDETIKE